MVGWSIYCYRYIAEFCLLPCNLLTRLHACMLIDLFAIGLQMLLPSVPFSISSFFFFFFFFHIFFFLFFDLNSCRRLLWALAFCIHTHSDWIRQIGRLSRLGRLAAERGFENSQPQTWLAMQTLVCGTGFFGHIASFPGKYISTFFIVGMHAHRSVCKTRWGSSHQVSNFAISGNYTLEWQGIH